MTKEIFNTYEFNIALGTAKINPVEGIELFKQYLEKYPHDYSAHTYYAKYLIVMGFLDEAESVLDQVSGESMEDRFFCSRPDKTYHFDRLVKHERLRILCYRERYEDVLDFISRNDDLHEYFNYRTAELFCRRKLGLLRDEKRRLPYSHNQIVNYSEEAFFEHIKKHFADNNIDLGHPNSSVFVPGFSKEIIKKSISFIPSPKKLLFGFFEDTYVFKFDECGRLDNKLTDYFKVIAFHNSQELITAYPSFNCSELPYTDLNYLQADDKPKVKVLSQTEKFYRRYGQRK